MPASRCAPSWTKRNIPKASRFPISRWLPSTLPATLSMATGTIRFHLIEKIIVQNELTELFMDEPLVAALAGASHMFNVVLGYAIDPQFERKEAIRLFRLALSLDDSDPETLAWGSITSAYRSAIVKVRSKW